MTYDIEGGMRFAESFPCVYERNSIPHELGAFLSEFQLALSGHADKKRLSHFFF